MAKTKTGPVKTTKKEAAEQVAVKPVKKVEKQAKKIEKVMKPSVKKTTSVEQTALVTSEKKEKNNILHLDIYDLTGNTVGTIILPAAIFAAKINPQLMTQAVRIYLANQRRGTVSTKTRGEVAGSTRKIYRQKGTGRARHGGVRAPIFVKGGIAHGPKPQDHTLSLPQKMRKAALLSALSTKVKAHEVRVLTGLQDAEMKTKIVANALKRMNLAHTVLLVTPEYNEKVYKSARNIPNITVTTSHQLNTYAVLEHRTILFMKEAVDRMEEVLGKKKEA